MATQSEESPPQAPAGAVSAPADGYAALAAAVEKAILKIAESEVTGWCFHATAAREILEDALSEGQPHNAPGAAAAAETSPDTQHGQS